MDPNGGFLSEQGASEPAIWRWRFEDANGAELPAPDSATPEGPRFTCQSDAESWVGEVWRELVDKGVDQVTLLEGDRMVYGPMSLHPSG